MRKQFIYSIISLVFLAIVSIANVALMSANTCLSEGFNNHDLKYLLSAMLVLPLYYHAVSEVLISSYAVYINSKDEKKLQLAKHLKEK
jgi:hypothetical protein